MASGTLTHNSLRIKTLVTLIKKVQKSSNISQI